MLKYLRTVLNITGESRVYRNRPPSKDVRLFIQARPQPPHVGQWLDVDGEPVHVRAAPDLDELTAEALRQMVRAVRQMPDKGE